MGSEKRRLSLISIILIIIVAGVIFGAIYYNNTFLSKEGKIKTSLVKGMETISNYSENLPETNIENKKLKSTFDIDFDLEFPDETGIVDIINDSKINIETITDLKEEYLNCNINYNYDNVDNNVSVIVDKDKIYLFLEEYFSKYINISDSIEFDFSELQTEDISYEQDLKYVIDEINKYIESSNITETKEVINIGNEKIDVTKTSLNVEVLLIKNIINRLESEYEDSDELKQISSMLEGYNNNDVIFTYNVYSKGFIPEFIKFEIEIEELDVLISYLNYPNDDFTYRFSIESKSSNESFDLNVIEDLKSENSFSYKYELLYNDEKMLTGEYSSKKIGEYNYDAEINIDLVGTEYGLNIEYSTNMEEITDIQKEKITNEVDIDKLTNYEIENIVEKFYDRNPSLKEILDEMFGEDEKIMSDAEETLFYVDIQNFKSSFLLFSADCLINYNANVDNNLFKISKDKYVYYDENNNDVLDDDEMFEDVFGENKDDVEAKIVDGVLEIESYKGIIPEELDEETDIN